MDNKTCEQCKKYRKLDGSCGLCRAYEPQLRIDCKNKACKHFVEKEVERQ